MSDPNQLDGTILSPSMDAADMATIRVTQSAPSAAPDLQTLLVTKPATSQTQAALEAPPLTSANPAAPVPFVFGRRIAQGGMGAILEASDCKLGRTIAVKVMLSEAGCSEEQKKRFIQEAAVLARLAHPNIVPVYDLGLDAEGALYYTMKLVNGRTLQHILDELRREHPEDLREFTLDRLLTIFRKVCDALAFAHSKGIIHRDLKPENIMVGEFGEVLVMDWGIAKILDGSADTSVRSDPGAIGAQESLRSSTASLTATMDGAVMGTPNYMSPEQAMGKVNEMDARSDIFSLGGILYCILTLRPPVEGKDVWEVLEKVSSANITAPTLFGATVTQGKAAAKGAVLEAKKITPLPHMTGGKVPAALSAVAMKALTLDKAKRYQDVAALSADIEAYQGGFATVAENAGAWKQLKLLVGRHKAVAAGIAAVLLVGTTFGTKAIIEGRRAEHEAARANAALADLKRQAPALRQLADSEAGFQRFEAGLDKLDAALSLDPAHLPSYWRRAWLLIGHEDFAGAAAAIRLAQQKDPAQAKLAAILPTIDALAAAPEASRWTPERAQAVYAHLSRVGAAGEALVLSRKLTLGAKEKEKLVRARLDEWLGKNKGRIEMKPDGGIHVVGISSTINTVEPLRGLPINGLSLNSTQVADLTPLKDMPLRWLEISRCTKITSLEPLRGMKLTNFHASDCEAITDWSPLTGMPIKSFGTHAGRVRDVSFLKGAPLEQITATVSGVVDISGLRGAPLREVNFSHNGISTLEPLAEAPLEELMVSSNPISDLSPLRGKPLRYLDIGGTKVADLSPLRGAPIEELHCATGAITDFRPLLELSKLTKVSLSRKHAIEVLREHPAIRFLKSGTDPKDPFLPAEEFWKQFDAWLAAEQRMKDAATTGREIGAAAIARLEAVRKEKHRDLKGKQITDLRALGSMSETRLSLSETSVTDLTPLRGLPLRSLSLWRSPVTDLSPLRGMPLHMLTFDETPVTDVSPLLDLPELEFAMIPKTAKNIEVLRQHPMLKFIGWEGDWNGGTQRPKLSAAEFWLRFDAERAEKK